MIRAAILQALARPGAPKRSALARAAGIAPENLTHWLAGRRPIPQEKIEAMLAALDLDVRPRVRAPDQRKLRYWIMGLESERGAAGSLNVDDEHEVAEVLRSFLDQHLPLSRRTLDALDALDAHAPARGLTKKSPAGACAVATVDISFSHRRARPGERRRRWRP